MNLEFRNSKVSNEPNKIVNSVEMEITGKNSIQNTILNDKMNNTDKTHDDVVYHGIRSMIRKNKSI